MGNVAGLLDWRCNGDGDGGDDEIRDSVSVPDTDRRQAAGRRQQRLNKQTAATQERGLAPAQTQRRQAPALHWPISAPPEDRVPPHRLGAWHLDRPSAAAVRYSRPLISPPLVHGAPPCFRWHRRLARRCQWAWVRVPPPDRRRPEQPAGPCQGLGIWAAWLCTSAERIPLWTRPAVVLPARL